MKSEDILFHVDLNVKRVCVCRVYNCVQLIHGILGTATYSLRGQVFIIVCDNQKYWYTSVLHQTLALGELDDE